MRKVFVFFSIIAALYAFPVRAQHFEWVRSYTGPILPNYSGPVNEIISSFTDGEGNLYFLGQYTGNAGFDGIAFASPLLVTPYSSTVLGKLSPSGELLWHKTLASTRMYCYPRCMVKASDSTLMISADLQLPFNNGVTNQLHNYVFYFDTLLTEDDGYLMPTDSIYSTLVTAFATFDFDGHLLEDHFLQIAYEDSLGNVIRKQIWNESYARIYTDILTFSHFTIDNEGNIIGVRYANDYVSVPCDTCQYASHNMSVANGEIGALRIVVDGLPRNTWYPPHKSNKSNIHLMKFSPGFDSLVSATYILDSTDIYAESFSSLQSGSLSSIETDCSGNIYVSFCYDGLGTVPIADSDTLYLTTTSCLMRYSPRLEPVKMYCRLITEPSDDENLFCNYYIKHSCFDSTGNLYLVGSIGTVFATNHPRPPHLVLCGQDTLELDINVFWLRIDTADGRVLSYGKAPSSVATFLAKHPADRVTCAITNGRIMVQVKYWTDIDAPETTINTDRGKGLMQWDTEGHVLSFIDFNAHSTQDVVGQTHLVDSAIYMTGYVIGGATFGPFQVEPSDAGSTYLVKYVDTSLMHPYVYSDPRQPQYIEWEQDLTLPLMDTLVMLTATATSGLPVGYSCDDSTVALVTDGVLQPLRVGTATVTATQGGSTYGYYPAAPVTKLVTIHNVGIDDIQNSKFKIRNLSIYPNPTAGEVQVMGAGGEVSEVLVLDMKGRHVAFFEHTDRFDVSGLPSGAYIVRVRTRSADDTDEITYLKLVKE